MKKSRLLSTLLASFVVLSSLLLASCAEKFELKLSSANNTTQVTRSSTLQFSTEVVSDKKVSGDISYVVISGDAKIGLESGLLTVDADAEIGSAITVKSVMKEINSNIITLTVVDQVATAVSLATPQTKLLAGENATITATITPASSTQTLSFEIVEDDATFATLSFEDNVATLEISADADLGSTVTVKATVGAVSAEIEFEVVDEDTLNDIVSNDILTVDAHQGPQTFAARILNSETGDAVTDKTVNFYVHPEDAGSMEVTNINNEYVKNTCLVTAKAHGTFRLVAQIDGTNKTKTIEVTSIVPPTAISLPEVFQTRTTYAFSKRTIGDYPSFITENKNLIPFVATPVGGATVCQDIEYVLPTGVEMAGDNIVVPSDFSGDALTVIAKSKSGSVRETEVSYTFNINDGYNVTTFEEYHAITNGTARHHAGKPVNITVFEKPVSAVPVEHAYGYDLVPAMLLENRSRSKTELQSLAFNIYGTTTINGNNHAINLSNQLVANDITTENVGRFLNFVSAETNVNFTVTLRDFIAIGNSGIEWSHFNATGLGDADIARTFSRGIQVSSSHSTRSYARVDFENVSVSKFEAGIRLDQVTTVGGLESILKNVTVSNCWSNGIEFSGSQATVENFVYGGLCGATAIELTPQKHTESPVLNEDGTFKEPTNQNIKFTGSMDVTGRVQTNGDTKRFNAIQFTEGAEVKIDENTTLTLDLSPLSLLRGTIIDLVGTSVHAEDIVSHVVKQVDDKEVFTFILLQFAFPSGNYSTFESDQMIELKDIKDEMNASGDDAVLHTEHKYIIVPLNSALGPLGYALLLNYHYEEPTN